MSTSRERTSQEKRWGAPEVFPPSANSCYFVVVAGFLRLRQTNTPTSATMIIIGIAITAASLDADETAMGSVIDCGSNCRWLSHSVLLLVSSWNFALSSVIVPFCIPCAMPVSGTIPVKFARYHTVLKAGGAGADTW